MRSCRPVPLLLAASLLLPAPLAGQPIPLSEVFVVSAPEPDLRHERPSWSQVTQGVPVAVALPHEFAVVSRKWPGFNDSEHVRESIDGQLIDESGQGGPVFLGETLDEYSEPELADPAIAATGSGGFVFVWTMRPWGVQARRFGPGGVPLGDVERLAETPDHRHVVYADPAVAAHPSGAFVVAWELTDEEESYSINARAFLPSGAPATPLLDLAPPQPGGSLSMPRAGMDAAGRMVVLWRQPGARPADPARLCGRGFEAGGAPLAKSFCLGSLFGSTGGALALHPETGFLAAWFGPAGTGGKAPLFVRRHDLSGRPLGSRLRVGTAAAPSALHASADRAGTTALSWVEGDRLRVLLVSRDGVAQGPAIGIPVASGCRESYDNGVALADSGRLLVTWPSCGSILGQLIKVSPGSPHTAGSRPSTLPAASATRSAVPWRTSS